MNHSAAPSTQLAATVFDRHGLGSPGVWGESGIPTDENRPDGSAAALCEALAQLGGIYAAFARFLGWRADLLGGSHIAQLYVAGVVQDEVGIHSFPAIYLWNQPTDISNHTPAWDVFQIPTVQ